MIPRPRFSPSVTCHCGAPMGSADAHADDCPWSCSCDSADSLGAWLSDRAEIRRAIRHARATAADVRLARFGA